MAGVTNKELKKEIDSKIKDVYTNIENIMKKQEIMGNLLNDIINSINIQQKQLIELENSLNVIAEKTLNNIEVINKHEKDIESYSDNKLGVLTHLVNNINKIIENNIE